MSETEPKLAIIITDEIFRCLSIRSGLPQLLCGPRVGRRARHTDVDHLARFQFDDEERKEGIFTYPPETVHSALTSNLHHPLAWLYELT